MKCVKCTGTLDAVDVGEIRIDRCGRCHGLWFDKNELDQVLAVGERAGADALPPSLRSPLSARLDTEFGDCPRCSVKLERIASIAVDSLHYDFCGACGGAWLDGGELDKLADNEKAAAIMSFFSKTSKTE